MYHLLALILVLLAAASPARAAVLWEGSGGWAFGGTNQFGGLTQPINPPARVTSVGEFSNFGALCPSPDGGAVVENEEEPGNRVHAHERLHVFAPLAMPSNSVRTWPLLEEAPMADTALLAHLHVDGVLASGQERVHQHVAIGVADSGLVLLEGSR